MASKCFEVKLRLLVVELIYYILVTCYSCREKVGDFSFTFLAALQNISPLAVQLDCSQNGSTVQITIVCSEEVESI